MTGSSQAQHLPEPRTLAVVPEIADTNAYESPSSAHLAQRDEDGSSTGHVGNGGSGIKTGSGRCTIL
jgi:hypothetical protein